MAHAHCWQSLPQDFRAHDSDFRAWKTHGISRQLQYYRASASAYSNIHRYIELLAIGKALRPCGIFADGTSWGDWKCRQKWPASVITRHVSDETINNIQGRRNRKKIRFSLEMCWTCGAIKHFVIIIMSTSHISVVILFIIITHLCVLLKKNQWPSSNYCYFYDSSAWSPTKIEKRKKNITISFRPRAQTRQ